MSTAGDVFQMLSWPGPLLGNAIQTLLRGAEYWDGAFIILGNLIIPVLFHIGWRWGVILNQKRKKSGSSADPLKFI